MIREDELGRAVAERPATGVRFRIRGGPLGAYLILALLALVYLIPLLFVLSVSLMSSRQFSLAAASFPDPIMWTNYPDAWGTGRRRDNGWAGRRFFRWNCAPSLTKTRPPS